MESTLGISERRLERNETFPFLEGYGRFSGINGQAPCQDLIVGGEAVIYHGYARLSGDVDFFFGLY